MSAEVGMTITYLLVFSHIMYFHFPELGKHEVNEILPFEVFDIIINCLVLHVAEYCL